MFSLPALDLSDIDVPILQKKDGASLTKDDVAYLTRESKENVLSLKGKISDSKIQAVCKQIDSFDYSPEAFSKALNDLDERLGLNSDRENLDLAKGCGTHFIISPVDEILPDEIETVETRRTTDQSSRLEKALLGFTNTMQDGSKPPIIARFRDHTLEGECIDRISESTFFTPSEFESADHHFQGRFNEFGQFKGTIKVFGQKIEEVIIPWRGGQNKETLCGSFGINIGYVQGSQRDSKIAPDLWKHLSRKTSRIGGLYIYRDGIRVLPYGDSDVDFLRIELRRTKSAKEYYFSYRNMLGYIDITRSENSSLHEKAGREGFIENKAYKQFKMILENFFIEIASAYFVDKGELSDLFIQQRKRHQELYETLKKREKLKSTKKKKLKENLENFFYKNDVGEWGLRIKALNQNVNSLFKEFECSSEGEGFDDFVFEVQEFLKERVHAIRSDIKITIPGGMGFGKEISGMIDKYYIYKGEIDEKLNEIEMNVERELIELEDKHGDKVGLRRRFDDSLKAQEEFYNKQLSETYKKAEESIYELTKWAAEELKLNRILAKESINSVREEFSSTSFSSKSSAELYQLKHSLEKKIEDTSGAILNKIEKLALQLNTARDGTDENTVSSGELTAALESEYEHLKEQNESNMEMVQLGMALGVVHHEFNNNIISIRRGLREMGPWAAKNQKLKPIYDRIRLGFDHLDGYLRTFTPLARRLNRKRTVITGNAIREFVIDVFDEKIIKENIIFKFSDRFVAFHLVSFTSTLYPAFVNIIDNAIFWVSKSSGEKTILLDADDYGFIIKDTGPGIPTVDRDNVFEFGFSKRIGGQGMGLYVAKQTLENDGLALHLDEYLPECGAVFRIYSKTSAEI